MRPDFNAVEIRLDYDDNEARLGLHDAPRVHNSLRAWAADERRQVLLPPRLRRHAERLLPKPRGQPRLPDVFLAAVLAEWEAAEKPRAKTLAAKYKLTESAIDRWRYMARDRGLLHEEGPTAKTRELLERDPRIPAAIIDSLLRRGTT